MVNTEWFTRSWLFVCSIQSSESTHVTHAHNSYHSNSSVMLPDIWFSWDVCHVLWLCEFSVTFCIWIAKSASNAGAAVQSKFIQHIYLVFALCSFNFALLKNQGWFRGLPDVSTFQHLTQLHQSTFPCQSIYYALFECNLSYLHVILSLGLKQTHHINISKWHSIYTPFYFRNVKYLKLLCLFTKFWFCYGVY